LNKENKEVIINILKTKGQTPRVYRNTVFFLYPLESERSGFINTIKRRIAYEYIELDQNLNLNDEQKKEVRKELKRVEADVKESIRRLYRIVSIPIKDGTKEIDLGIPTYGEEKALDQEVFDKLRSNGEILSRIAPLVLREKYLSSNNYVLTGQLYQSSLKTPGETRLLDSAVLEEGIAEGVRSGLFGLGELENGKPVCRYYREQPSIAFSSSEVLISETLCIEQMKKKEPITAIPGIISEPGPSVVKESEATWVKGVPTDRAKKKVQLRFQIPKGKVAGIMGVMNLLQSKFDSLEVEIVATDGEISEQDFEDKIMEAFRQLGIERVKGEE